MGKLYLIPHYLVLTFLYFLKISEGLLCVTWEWDQVVAILMLIANSSLGDLLIQNHNIKTNTHLQNIAYEVVILTSACLT